MIDVLRRLNPTNRLFGRVFIWFWVSVILILAITAFLLKSSLDSVAYTPADNDKLQQLNQAARQIDTLLQQRHRLTPVTLRRLAQKHQQAYLLWLPQQQRWLTSLPRLPRFKAQMQQIAQQPTSFVIDTAAGQFIGPADVSTTTAQAYLFIGNQHPPKPFDLIRTQSPWLLVMIMIGFSGLLCFWLSWSLTRPLARLSAATKRLAEGQLDTRLASDRHDEIGQLTEAFNQMAAHTQQLIQGQKRTLADISHELRSPLTRIQVALGIIEQQQGPSQPINRIHKDLDQFEALLEQILTLAKLDAGRFALDCTPVDVLELISELVEQNRFFAQQQQKQVHLTPDTDIPTINGDIRLLSQSVDNVIRNAVEHARKEVWVTLSLQKAHLTISIADDGAGIREDALADIFTPFYRPDNARDRKDGGVGLGLAITASGITAHGGHVKAYNRTTGGLRVDIRLPLHQS